MIIRILPLLLTAVLVTPEFAAEAGLAESRMKDIHKNIRLSSPVR